LTCDRESARRAFLHQAGLADARRQALSGDASTRAYERLTPPSGPSLIFMDQPPALETQPCPPHATAAEREALGYNALTRLAAGRVEAFVACAAYLRDQGLSAPAVVVSDPRAGFAVLEDLGDDLYATRIAAGDDETPLYDNAVDVLLRLHSAQPPTILRDGEISWPLLTYDALAFRTAADLFVEWLPRLDPRLTFSPDAIAEWRAVWDPIAIRGEAGATVFCHRDYHAENLIWLPDRLGAARTGLLDFQDALCAHPAWDFSMLLHDARRDVTAEREDAVLARYLAGRPEVDREGFMADFHALGALNLVRLLGLFPRLVVRDAKPRYRDFMPRLWRYLGRCLQDPAPPGLRAWLDAHVPPEART
jgi:aminoglycoside/choline kinase family phosphotransferase